MQGSKPVTRVALAMLAAAAISPLPVMAQGITAVGEALHSGQIDVPLNKSQVVRSTRNFTKAMISNPEIADIMPMTNRSLYVLGKKPGTTSLTLYEGANLVSVIDINVGPDVVSLRRQLSDLMPGEKISVTSSNDSVVLSGTVSSGPAVERASKIAATYAGEKVVNMLSVGASQQVMLEVRFSEVTRAVGKQLGFNTAFRSDSGKVVGGIGNTGTDSALLTDENGRPVIALDKILDSFGVAAGSFDIGSLNIATALDALERKGVVKTLAEPTLIALSGETASFLAGGEFPIPVSEDGGGDGNGSITIEFKPFGVSLGFTPTVLDDGVINLVVAPEVSSIDPSASVTVNGLTVPGLQTRRAKTTLELRDGQSFALAGLLRKDFRDTVRQFPILGSIPIIGTLFRSSGFQKDETELVIIVTPRLVKPIKAEDVRLPTDRVGEPHELDLFLMGRTDNAVGLNPLDPNTPPPERKGAARSPAPTAAADKPSGMDGPTGHEF